MKITIAMINNQEFFPIKVTTSPAVLKINDAIAPAMPGRIAATFFTNIF